MENIFKQINCPSIIKITHSYPISIALALEQEACNILGEGSTAYVNGVDYSSGAIKVKGSALFNILYKEEGKILSYESSADIAFEISDSRITANSLVDLKLSVKNTKVFKGERGLELTAEIYAEGYFNRVQSINVLEDVEGAIVKKAEINPLCFVKCFNATAQIDGEKNLPYFVERVICHGESARVLSATVGHGEIIVDGEILSDALIVKQNGERVTERIITPFKYEIDCDGATPNQQACVNACVNRAIIKISSDEAVNKSTASVEYSLFLTGVLAEQTPVNCVIDGFSVLNELSFERENVEFAHKLEQVAIKHKHFGEGDITLALKDVILASTFCRVEDLEVKKESDDKIEISGVVSCLVILKKESGELYGERVLAPVLITTDCKYIPDCVGAQAQGVVARNLDGKCLLEIELVFTFAYMQSESQTVAVNAIVGEEREQRNSAFSVVFIDKGDDLWTVCKKALSSEQAILADNPDMTFPVGEARAVVVYKKL